MAPVTAQSSKTDSGGDAKSRRHKPYKYRQSKKLPTTRLDQLLPRAGLIYPFKHGIMRYQTCDNRIGMALADSIGIEARQLEKSFVSEQVANVFRAATMFVDDPSTPGILCRPPVVQGWIDKLGADEQVNKNGDPSSIGALSFLFCLRNWLVGEYAPEFVPPQGELGTFDWITRITSNMFAAFFLLLRSARLRWQKYPRFPFDMEEHSHLAKVISEFNVAGGRVDWGGMEMVLWLKNGAMWMDPRSHEERRHDDANAESAGLVADLEKLSVEGNGTAEPLGTDEIVALLADLCIECTWTPPQ